MAAPRVAIARLGVRWRPTVAGARVAIARLGVRFARQYGDLAGIPAVIIPI